MTLQQVAYIRYVKRVIIKMYHIYLIQVSHVCIGDFKWAGRKSKCRLCQHNKCSLYTISYGTFRILKDEKIKQSLDETHKKNNKD